MTSISFVNIAENAVIVELAAFLTSKAPWGTGALIGGTYSLVSQITKPFFEQGGVLSILCNLCATTTLVSFLSQHSMDAVYQYSLRVMDTASIAYLPLIVLFKFMATAAVIMTVSGALYYTGKKLYARLH